MKGPQGPPGYPGQRGQTGRPGTSVVPRNANFTYLSEGELALATLGAGDYYLDPGQGPTTVELVLGPELAKGGIIRGGINLHRQFFQIDNGTGLPLVYALSLILDAGPSVATGVISNDDVLVFVDLDPASGATFDFTLSVLNGTLRLVGNIVVQLIPISLMGLQIVFTDEPSVALDEGYDLVAVSVINNEDTAISLSGPTGVDDVTFTISARMGAGNRLLFTNGFSAPIQYTLTNTTDGTTYVGSSEGGLIPGISVVNGDPNVPGVVVKLTVSPIFVNDIPIVQSYNIVGTFTQMTAIVAQTDPIPIEYSIVEPDPVPVDAGINGSFIEIDDFTEDPNPTIPFVFTVDDSPIDFGASVITGLALGPPSDDPSPVFGSSPNEVEIRNVSDVRMALSIVELGASAIRREILEAGETRVLFNPTGSAAVAVEVSPAGGAGLLANVAYGTSLKKVRRITADQATRPGELPLTDNELNILISGGTSQQAIVPISNSSQSFSAIFSSHSSGVSVVNVDTVPVNILTESGIFSLEPGRDLPTGTQSVGTVQVTPPSVPGGAFNITVVGPEVYQPNTNVFTVSGDKYWELVNVTPLAEPEALCLLQAPLQYPCNGAVLTSSNQQVGLRNETGHRMDWTLRSGLSAPNEPPTAFSLEPGERYEIPTAGLFGFTATLNGDVIEVLGTIAEGF